MSNKILIFIVTALVIGLVKYFTVASALPSLGYRVCLVSKKGREAEYYSAIFMLIMWIGIFLLDLFSNATGFIDPIIFTMLIGCMAGICISTIYTLHFMPKGLYENGVLTETRAISYKQINKHTVAKAPRKDIYRYTFESKKGERTKYNLYVPEINKKEIDVFLRKKGK